MPQLISIQVAKPASFEATLDSPLASKPWTTGIYKQVVDGPVGAKTLGLEGDGQADDDHGGVDKAICVYSADHFPQWRVELAKLNSNQRSQPPQLSSSPTGFEGFPNGGFGENFTVAGLTEADVCIGDCWQIGDTTFEVSQPRQPCWKLARRWNLRDLALLVKQNGKTGWYLRVLTEGQVAGGDELKLIRRVEPDWTISRANDVMHGRDLTQESARELFSLASLSAAWKDDLQPRLAQ